MRKVGIITFHRALNYGALLQTYALQETLSNQGYETKIIDYRCDVIEQAYYFKSLFERKGCKEILKWILQGSSEKRKRKKFDDFRNEYLNLTEIDYTNNTIGDSNDLFDTFITGSDQVWNYRAHDFDKNYFLTFVESNERKYSYAASIGLSDLPKEYITQYLDLLREFKVCSVREKQGADLLQRIGIENLRVDIDPTILFDKNQWIDRMGLRRRKDKYIFVYYFELTNTMKLFVERLAMETGLKVVYVGNAMRSPFTCKCVGLKTAGPVEFLDAIYNAEYVVTNSFHGVAFSIIFCKTFFVELLETDAAVNSRLINILSMTNLLNRQINVVSKEDLLVANSDIQWEQVNETLDLARTNAIKYLRSFNLCER